MPKPFFYQGEFVFIYDVVNYAFGIIQNCRVWTDEETQKRIMTYGVLTFRDTTTHTCPASTLRRALWTFTGPVVVSGNDVDSKYWPATNLGLTPRRTNPLVSVGRMSGQRCNLQNPWSKIQLSKPKAT